MKEQASGQLTDFAARENAEYAILHAILYSDLFDYPLTVEEIARFIGQPIDGLETIQSILSTSERIHGQISQTGKYFTLRGREGLINLRVMRARTSRRLWRMARFYCRILGNLPFIKMIAVTGALAMNNSDPQDDVDLLIVTGPGRVWLTRMLAVLVVCGARATGTRLCPNYLISQNALALDPRNVYTAHEFAQMVPIFGRPVYEQMRIANAWVWNFLPNANSVMDRESEYRPGRFWRAMKYWSEWCLSGKFGDRLESWEMNRKIRKFSAKTRIQGNGVVLDRDHVKGHFEDHSEGITAEYQRRIEDLQRRMHND
jgi:hypothetical protein